MVSRTLDEKAQALPTLNIKGDIDIKELYVDKSIIECRRCLGNGTDPDGDYPCLLCHGAKEEKLHGELYRYCSKHTDILLVDIGKRHVEWEDSQGFDHQGYVAVKGCPICNIPACSIMWG